MENGKTIIIRNLEELTAALAAPADAAAEKLIIDGQGGVISGVSHSPVCRPGLSWINTASSILPN